MNASCCAIYAHQPATDVGQGRRNSASAGLEHGQLACVSTVTSHADLHDWQAAVSKTIGDFQSGVLLKQTIHSDAILLALLVLQIQFIGLLLLQSFNMIRTYRCAQQVQHSARSQCP